MELQQNDILSSLTNESVLYKPITVQDIKLKRHFAKVFLILKNSSMIF